MRENLIWAARVVGAFCMVGATCCYLSFVEFSFALQPLYGVAELETDAPQKIYLRREVWGILGSHDLSGVTTNPERCRGLDRETDYVDPSSDSGSFGLVYRWEAGALHLYEGEEYPQLPENPEQFPVPVVRHNRLGWSRYHHREDLQLKGYKLAFVDVHDNPPCAPYWEIFFDPLGLKRAVRDWILHR